MLNPRLAVHLPSKVPISNTSLKRAFVVSSGSRVHAPYRVRDSIALHKKHAAILEYLDVNNSPRYAPEPNATYCNIFACDFCALALVYLPRVWWTVNTRGESIPSKVLYGGNVREMRVNDLFDWLNEFGYEFGWRPEPMHKAQEAVNQGAVGLILARHKIPSRSGHVSIIMPETEEHKAVYWDGGRVKIPLQSCAGRRNRTYFATEWYIDPSTFAGYGAWVHE